MDLSKLQKELAERWGSSEYSDEYNARPDPQRNAHHALLHITKASGKLAAGLDDLDHGNATGAAIETAIADIIICAVRLGGEWPERPIDVAEVVRRRLESKFPPKRACALHDDCEAADRAQKLVDHETVARHSGTPDDR